MRALPQSLMKTVTLFSHQERAVLDTLDRLYNHGGAAIIHDPGLGKTLTALTVFERLTEANDARFLVVVCPRTLYGTWQDQIETHTKFGEAFEFLSAKASGKKYGQEIDAFADYGTIILINYEALRDPKDGLKNLLEKIENRSLVILDESTRIKNPMSQQSKGIKKFLGRFKYRIIMTGTEITKDALDLYAQFEFVKTGIWGERSFSSYKARYALQEPLYLPNGKITMKVVGFQRMDRLQQLIAPVTSRAKKEDCFDLPPKIFQDIPVDLSPEEARAYKELKTILMTILESGEIISVERKIALFMRFRTVTGGWADTTHQIVPRPAKLATLCDMVEDEDSQAIIWSSFTHEIKMLEKELSNYGKCVTYYGEKTQEDRVSSQNRFTSGDARFFIGNPSTGALGLNLQNCTLQYFYSLPSQGEHYLQSLDRSHRIGTLSAVVYRRLLARLGRTDSIDFRIKEILAGRADLLHAFQTRPLYELVRLV